MIFRADLRTVIVYNVVALDNPVHRRITVLSEMKSIALKHENTIGNTEISNRLYLLMLAC